MKYLIPIFALIAVACACMASSMAWDAVTNNVDGSAVTVPLAYRVTVNGVEQITSNTQATVTLKTGANTLTVSAIAPYGESEASVMTFTNIPAKPGNGRVK